jgi:hypothetical protein
MKVLLIFDASLIFKTRKQNMLFQDWHTSSDRAYPTLVSKYKTRSQSYDRELQRQRCKNLQRHE